MNRLFRPQRTVCLGLIALAVLGVQPALAAAGGIGFRNDLTIPVIVQGETVINGTLRRGQPLLIAPRKAAYDTNLKAGQRRITVYDANNTNRVLLRVVLPYDGSDVNFRVVLVPGSDPRLPPRVQLIPLLPQ